MKTDDGVLIIPPSEGIHLLATTQYTNLLINCLSSYFGQKKKTLCAAVDEENDIISSKDVSFIYIPSDENVDQWFAFKQKTPMNTELAEMISTNPELFMSMDMIRTVMKSLLTDSGMYRFKEILQKGTDINMNVSLQNYDIHTVLSNLQIESETFSNEQKHMLAYNLLLYLNRNKYTVIYIDFKVTEEVSRWLTAQKADNRLFLVCNDSVLPSAAGIFDSMIVPDLADHVTTIEAGIEQAGLYCYLFHPVVRENMSYQTEKNIVFMKQFMEQNTTFSIRFTLEYTF